MPGSLLCDLFSSQWQRPECKTLHLFGPNWGSFTLSFEKLLFHSWLSCMDVTRNNFNDIIPLFEKDLQQCQFISIDTEFTGANWWCEVVFVWKCSRYENIPLEYYYIFTYVGLSSSKLSTGPSILDFLDTADERYLGLNISITIPNTNVFGPQEVHITSLLSNMEFAPSTGILNKKSTINIFVLISPDTRRILTIFPFFLIVSFLMDTILVSCVKLLLFGFLEIPFTLISMLL